MLHGDGRSGRDDDDGRLWSAARDGFELRHTSHGAWPALPQLWERFDRRFLIRRSWYKEAPGWWNPRLPPVADLWLSGYNLIKIKIEKKKREMFQFGIFRVFIVVFLIFVFEMLILFGKWDVGEKDKRELWIGCCFMTYFFLFFFRFSSKFRIISLKANGQRVMRSDTCQDAGGAGTSLRVFLLESDCFIVQTSSFLATWHNLIEWYLLAKLRSLCNCMHVWFYV